MSFKKFRIPKLFKTPLFLGMVFCLIFSFCFLVFQKEKTPEGSFNKFNKIDELYLFGQEAFKSEYLSLNLIQGYFLKSLSSPFPISTKVYGAIGETEKRDEPIEYIVQKGDTLSSIAEKFGISSNTILWANNLTEKSKLTQDQRLLILPVSGLVHIVQSRETVSEIAKKYKTASEKIIEFNELSDDGKIFKGDILIVPDGVMPPQTTFFAQVTELPGSYFGFPTQGIISRALHWYNAIDIANNCYTTPIVAAASGKVIEVKTGWNRGCGNLIKIEHTQSLYTVYCHLSKISVSAGENVGQGQLIGMMGNTGRTRGPTGCHLHFSVIGATNPLAKYKLGTTISWK